MNSFLSDLSARVDATASHLKCSLHEHVDTTVDSRLDTFKHELTSMVRSGVVDLDEQSDNGHQALQQMNNDDNPDTNPFHNVTLNIKTEQTDSDFVVVKEEIKEEDDEDDYYCGVCYRWLVMKEVVSDGDDDGDEQVVNEDGHEKIQQIDEVANEGEVIRGYEHEVNAERFDVIPQNLDNGELFNNPSSRNIQNASNENDSIEGFVTLASEQQVMLNTASNEPNEQTVTHQSGDLFSLSISTGPKGSNRIALNEQEAVSTQPNVNKQKQPTLIQTVKGSKQIWCIYPDCTASFALKDQLKAHECIHLIDPFHCSWPQCRFHTNRHRSLFVHIRTQHFGFPLSFKEQKAKNIVDNRDPNDYVRVVIVHQISM